MTKEAFELHKAECLEVLTSFENNSVDLVFSDPPYPYVERDYGYWTEETWFPLMHEVVRQSRRILKPNGSAVFILQPNSEGLGSMRPWLWKFLVWCAEEWNIVQDIYWWQVVPIPEAQAIQGRLTRPSLKYCVWLGNSDCFRNQEQILWDESFTEKMLKNTERANNQRKNFPSGHGIVASEMRLAVERRGGVTPMNVLPIPHAGKEVEGHSAPTPKKLAEWWIRYLTIKGEIVVDMFNGSGTTGVAALQLGRKYIGIERVEDYYQVSLKRLEKASGMPISMNVWEDGI